MRNRLSAQALGWIGAVALFMMNGADALAITTLKQVQVSNGSEITLLFDGKISRSQIQTEYINDIVQVSLTDVGVYPAKISSVNGGDVVKVFAYQYAPKLVRCRFTVKGKAENYKDRLQLQANGKMLTVRFAAPESQAVASDRITTHAAAPEAAPKQAPAQVADEAEQKALLEHVLNSKPAAEAQPAEKAQKEKESAPGKSAKADREKEKDGESRALTDRKAPATQSLASGKPLPGLFNTLVKLAAVLSLFGIVALIFRKLAGRNGGVASKNDPALVQALSRFGLGGLVGKKEKLINVLATHHLGPKKSISVVKVAGRLLVLGVSSESINLITEIPDEVSDDPETLGEFAAQTAAQTAASMAATGPKIPVQAQSPTGASAAGRAVFADLLSGERGRSNGAAASAYRNSMNMQQAPAADQGPASAVLNSTKAPAAQTNVRSQIRSRLEGLKPL